MKIKKVKGRLRINGSYSLGFMENGQTPPRTVHSLYRYVEEHFSWDKKIVITIEIEDEDIQA